MKIYFILLLATISWISLAAAVTNKIFCYYGSWAVYRRSVGKVSVDDIDPTLCSHLIYTFVGLNNDGSIKILDSWNDIENGGFAKFVNLKARNPNVKTLVAIGGWNEGSARYSNVVNSPTARTKLVNEILAFTLRHGFDGFDLDWEYPAERGGASTDRDAYVQLLKELRPKFDVNNLILTAAVAAPKSYHTSSYNVPELSIYLDFINVMSYDLHGSWDGVTGQNAPLYARSSQPYDELTVDRVIQSWIQAGADPQKIVLGIGLYGRSFTLNSATSSGLGASTISGGTAGSYSAESGMLMYQEVCAQQAKGGWTIVWDDEQKVPYTYKGNQWVGYDNTKSVILKSEYAVLNNLAGVMVWSVESDDVKNVCNEGYYPLLSAINTVIDITEIKPEEPIITLATTILPPTTLAVTTIAPLPPTATIIPETTVNSTAGKFTCSDNGFYPDPNSCVKYYKCMNVGNTLTAIALNCPYGLHFDENHQNCQRQEIVKCTRN